MLIVTDYVVKATVLGRNHVQGMVSLDVTKFCLGREGY